MGGIYRNGLRYEWDNGGSGPPSTLLPDILAYWQLNEASGTRAEITGAHPLTDNNTVGNVAGRVGNAALFVNGNQEWLDNVTVGGLSLPPGVDFTMSCWVWADLLAGAAIYGRGVLSFHNGTTTGDWAVGVQATGEVTCYHWRNDGADLTGRHTTNAAFITLGAWHHIIFRCAAGVYTIWVNGVSRAFTDDTTQTGWGSGQLALGRLYDAFDQTYYFVGRIDEVGIWDRAITPAEIANLYNGGNGITYPF